MVRRERIVNNVQTSLDGAINSSVTSITVDDGSVFPSEGDFRILIESEVMLVTARSTNILTVIRAVDGTNADAHANVAGVNAILTSDGLSRLMDDVLAGPSDRNPLRLLDGGNTLVTTSDFSWINQGTSSVTDDADGGITMKIPETSGGHRMRFMAAPSTPYTITSMFVTGPGILFHPTAGTAFGLSFRESSTGSFMYLSYEAGEVCEIAKYTGPSTFSANVAGTPRLHCDSYWVWQQIEDDGTDLIFRVSTDGINFFDLGSEGRTVFMSGSPNEVGWVCTSRGEVDKLLHLKSWAES